MSCDEFSVGVLFENSIVCHVFYAIGPGGCAWWTFVCCVWFLGFVLFWFAWLFFWGWVGPGLVFWTVVLTLGSGWLFVVGWGFFVGFVWRV